MDQPRLVIFIFVVHVRVVDAHIFFAQHIQMRVLFVVFVQIEIDVVVVGAVQRVQRSRRQVLIVFAARTVGIFQHVALMPRRRLWHVMHRMFQCAFARIQCDRLFHVECLLDFRFLVPHFLQKWRIKCDWKCANLIYYYRFFDIW